MNNYYLTFPTRYAKEVHPYSPNIHPDKWIRIQATSYTNARHLVHKLFGTKWAFLYPQRDFDSELAAAFPGGELEVLTAE